MTSMLPPVRTEAEAREIMASGLGRAELEFAMSLTAPLFWVMREGDKRSACATDRLSFSMQGKVFSR
jgi:hypothetical protein